MLKVIGLGLALVVLGAIGFGAATVYPRGDGDETASHAAQRQFEMLAKGQYGPFYDELHPRLQAGKSRADWMDRLAAADRKSIFSLGSVRIVESYAEPFRFTNGDERDTTAVTIAWKNRIGALPEGDNESTTTVHEERIDGHWRLIVN